MFQKIFSLFAIITISLVSSQTIPRTENICFFQDAKSGKPITIVNDSLVYKGELINPSILKHTDYPGIINDYQYHFNINNRNFFIHAGCGPVLEYRNDSIVRIDKAFMQKNQYCASPFVYNNQICLFGGYGLFSFKNMITRYDFKTKEWLRIYENKGEKPRERSNTHNFYNTNGFYFFGGWTDNNTIIQSYEKDPQLWYLDYSTFQWHCIGNYNSELKNINPEFIFKSDTKLYEITSEYILELDFLENNVTWYKNNTLISLRNIVYDKNTETLFYLTNLSANNESILVHTKLSELLKHPIKTEELYYSPWQEYVLPLIYITILLLLLFGIYKLVVHQKGKYFEFHQTKNKFYYKSKIISNLDPLEEKIFVYLFQNIKSYIQLNQLNSFFDKESPDNFANIIKKRDLVFSSLIVKLNAITIQVEKPLMLIQKNEADKRIKEIRLNPLYFTLK